MAEPKPLDERFRWYAEKVFLPTSPLYARLARFVAGEPELLALAAEVGEAEGQPVPNLLFGSVQFLMLQGVHHPLADYFPSVTADALEPAGVESAFRAFCDTHREEIRFLLRTRRVQTNEVRRCVHWLPSFHRVHQLAGGQRLAMIEAGCSAGLNLNWDRYGYRYSDGRVLGDPNSPVQLTCELLGERMPPMPERFPLAASKWGIDLHPVDIGDPNEALWLQALIWPEQAERRQALQGAFAVAETYPPQLLAGDVFEQLPKVVGLAPPEQPVCVYHSFMANQLPAEGRDRLADLFVDLGSARTVYRLAMEWVNPTPHPTVELTTYSPAGQNHEVLAYCDQHGRWLEWLA